METHRVFGTYLRKVRLSKQITLRQLADHLGCSEPYLSDVELGRRSPLTDSRIHQAAAFLGIEASELRVKAAVSRGKFKLPTNVSAKHDETAVRLAMAWESLSDRDLETINRVLKKTS
jgi:transcriptional regulator with XRE-family HTH domain